VLWARPDQHFFISVSYLLNTEIRFTQLRELAVSISMTTYTSGRILCHYQTTAPGGCRDACTGFSGALVLYSYWNLTEDILVSHIKFQRQKKKTGEREYRPHFVRVPDSRRLKGIWTVEGISKYEGNKNKQERQKEFSWEGLQQIYRNIW